MFTTTQFKNKIVENKTDERTYTAAKFKSQSMQRNLIKLVLGLCEMDILVTIHLKYSATKTCFVYFIL